MLIAVPVGLMIAFFLTELCPMFLRRPIGIAIELLAGIPSIIYGIWGLFVFAPFLQRTLQPFLITVFGDIPVLSSLFAGPPYGIGMLTAGLILAIMVLPFITSISRDVFDAVPPVLKEAAYGLGCTKWEVFRNVVLPYTRVGVIGGVMLGLGRALGETMAVTFVIGNAHRISASILAPGTTISATIANEFTEAVGDLYTSSLIALGLILFVITFVVLADRALPAAAHRTADRVIDMRRKLYAAPPPPQRHRDRSVAGRHGLRPWLAGADPWRLALEGLERPVAGRLHRNDAAAGLRRRTAECDRRQPDHDRAGGAVGTPVGILAGTYMAEYGRYDRLTSVVRFINDILLSAPSIVDRPVRLRGHGRSRWGTSRRSAGAVALAVIVLPVVVRTTEDMLLLVPDTLREAAAALGVPRCRHHPQGRAIARRRPACSPACCSRSRASAARPRRCCSRRSTTSSGAPISTRRWPTCRSSSSSSRSAPMTTGRSWPGPARCSSLSLFSRSASPRARLRFEETVMNVASVQLRRRIPTVVHAAVDRRDLREKISIRDLNFFYGDSRALKDINAAALREAR